VQFLVFLPAAPRVVHPCAFRDPTNGWVRRTFYPLAFNVFFPLEKQKNAFDSDEIGTARERFGTGVTEDEVRIESGPKSFPTTLVETAIRPVQERPAL
jgi:hypothetical protein